MIQTTAGLFVIGWKLAITVIAGSTALTTIGVFLLARFTAVFDAYAGERAKLAAQFQNLDRLVQQTEKLTATAETIKARVSSARDVGSAGALDIEARLLHEADGNPWGTVVDVEARNKLLEQIRRPGNRIMHSIQPRETGRCCVRKRFRLD